MPNLEIKIGLEKRDELLKHSSILHVVVAICEVFLEVLRVLEVN